MGRRKREREKFGEVNKRLVGLRIVFSFSTLASFCKLILKLPSHFQFSISLSRELAPAPYLPLVLSRFICSFRPLKLSGGGYNEAVRSKYMYM